MTTFSPHPTLCPELRFSVLPAHPTTSHPPWMLYKEGHARPCLEADSSSDEWSARPWDRAASFASRPDAGDVQAGPRKVSPGDRGRSQPAVTTQFIATPSTPIATDHLTDGLSTSFVPFEFRTTVM